MDREAVDKFLAEADDVIADWTPGIDAAGWKADGSHQVPDVPRDSMYEGVGGVDVDWYALVRNWTDWTVLPPPSGARTGRWPSWRRTRGSSRARAAVASFTVANDRSSSEERERVLLEHVSVTRVMSNGRLVLSTEHLDCAMPSGCQRCSRLIVDALLEQDPEVRRAIAFHRTRSSLRDYGSQIWVSLDPLTYSMLTTDRRMFELVCYSPAGPVFYVRDIAVYRGIPAEQISYPARDITWTAVSAEAAEWVARAFDVPAELLDGNVGLREEGS